MGSEDKKVIDQKIKEAERAEKKALRQRQKELLKKVLFRIMKTMLLLLQRVNTMLVGIFSIQWMKHFQMTQLSRL